MANSNCSGKYISETSDYLPANSKKWEKGPDLPDVSGGWPGIGVGQLELLDLY